MPFARTALEFVAVLSAATATLAATLLIFAVGMAPHTVSNGNEIDAAFLRAKEFVDQRIQSTGHMPMRSEFQKWRSSGEKWVSQIELTKSSASNSEIQSRFGKLPENAYVLSVWRGEWSEYYVQGKGSSVDSASGLYASCIGIALAACCSSAALWLLAGKLKRSNSLAAR